MAALWHEKLALQPHTGRRSVLLPDAAAHWSVAITPWLDDPRCAVLVAEVDHMIVGFIIGRIEANAPGLAPAEIGVIAELVVDAHSNQGGLGRRLLDPLCAWFEENGIHDLRAQIAPGNPVEQAFWRALGAVHCFDVMWMRI